MIQIFKLTGANWTSI